MKRLALLLGIISILLVSCNIDVEQKNENAIPYP